MYLIFIFVSELLQKINRTTCTIKYDLQYLNDKVSNLENMLLKQDGCIIGQFMDQSSDKFQNKFLNLPLETEEELDAFEKNILNNVFRTKMVVYFQIKFYALIS